VIFEQLRARRALRLFEGYFKTNQRKEALASAIWFFQKAQEALSRNVQSEAKDWLYQCFWHIMFAHFRDPESILSGYNADLTLADVSKEIVLRWESTLAPKLLAVASSQGKQRIIEVAQLVRVVGLMLDPNGITVQKWYFRDVFGTQEDIRLEEDAVKIPREFLERLGFKQTTIQGKEIWHLV
jgi:hypothetical protein